jgi:hypothetical protein
MPVSVFGEAHMFDKIVGVATILVAIVALADFGLRWLRKPIRAEK